MPTLDEVSRVIGNVESSLAHLTDLVSRNTGIMEGISADVTALTPTVENIKEDVAAMQPVVQKFERYEQRVLGVAAVVAGAMGALGPVVFAWFRERFGA